MACNLNKQILVHPRRPRGSQSGWVKRRDESFQEWAEEPLGTDSHRTISKQSRECWFLIGHKKCFVSNRRTASPEFCSRVRTRRLLSRHSCQVRSPSFRNQKQRNYRWVKKNVLDAISRSRFALINSVSDGSQCIVNNRRFQKVEFDRPGERSPE